MNLNRLGFLLLLFFTFITYRFFISTDLFIAHDWPMLFGESRDFSPFWALSWDYTGNGGIGSSAFKTLWIDLYTNLTYAISNSANIPWWLSQRIFWILPFVSISLISSYKVAGLFLKESFFKVLSSIIYSFNTYILLVVAGGQFGIAFSYALAPFALFYFMNVSKKPDVRKVILFGILLGLLIASDPRIAFLVLSVGFFWYLIFVRNFKKTYSILISLLIALFVNSYWLLPLILLRGQSEVFSGYTSLEEVKFLSFANFSNSMSLLHPNWPENIFGKTYFLRPEFLIIPFLAFSTLVLKMKKEIVFLTCLSLAGIFLGKGASEPFGQVYLFLFEHIPGFNLFRDSTKFFIFIALSYSILIPYLFERLPRLKYILASVFVLYWLFTLKPAWDGELTGVFKPKAIPNEYLLLQQTIKNDPSFYRTLWIPQRQKYGYFDSHHPAMDRSIQLREDLLKDLSVKYVIVPYDADYEIFLKEREYDEELYNATVKKLEDTEWLKRVEGFGKLAIFEVNNHKNHFWSPSSTLKVNYDFINPTEYRVKIQNAEKGDLLVFSEGFDKNWTAESSRPKDDQPMAEKFTVRSSQHDKLNSFVLPEGNLELTVYYEPQKYVELGLGVSAVTFFVSIIYLIILRFDSRIN